MLLHEHQQKRAMSDGEEYEKRRASRQRKRCGSAKTTKRLRGCMVWRGNNLPIWCSILGVWYLTALDNINDAFCCAAARVVCDERCTSLLDAPGRAGNDNGAYRLRARNACAAPLCAPPCAAHHAACIAK